MKILFIFFFFLICSSDIILNEYDNEEMNTVMINDIIRIELKTNPSTGYSWKVRKIDSFYLKEINHGIMDDEKDIQPGSEYTEFWEFKTIGKGYTFIYMYYTNQTNDPITTDYIVAFRII